MSWAIWITGRPGTGKTTIAQQVVAVLQARGEPVALLEASEFARALVSGRAPSPNELDLIHRAVVQAAAALVRAGVPVIIDATAHRRAWRDLAGRGSRILPRFSSPVRRPSAPPASRQCAGARTCTSAGAPRRGPEVVLDYEYSFRAELTVDTHVQHVSSAVADVLRLVERLRRDVQRAAPPDALRPAQ